ncbi:DUF2326 domain-containing protein [Lysinibacillus agricola]|uniref:DUF2326 domain-containing protein n=1 Tax=Lysinibacillus agricola TaxID=2590012 RepID=UPI003C207C53
MSFERLIIYSKSENKILKEYKFNTFGVNIILGEKRDNNDETNGVGKTTMIDCISFLLGRTIPTYYQNSPQLLEKDVYLILEITSDEESIYLCRTFNEPKVGYTLLGKVLELDLSAWTRYSTLPKYKQFIQSIMLEGNPTGITFASLREYIMRDEKTGFNDTLISNRNALKQYQYLGFLFDLPYETEMTLKSLRETQNELGNKIKLIESMGYNIADLKLLEGKIVDSLKELERQISNSKTIEHYNKNLEKYNNNKSRLNEVQTLIFEYEHIIKQYNENIENLKIKVEEIKKVDDLEEFYNELVGHFPNNVKRNFIDIKEFYDFMLKSRGRFFKNKISEINLELENLYKESSIIKEKIEKDSKILKSSDFIGDLSSLMEQKKDKEVELGQIRLRLSDYNKKNDINAEINQIQQELIRLTEIKNEEFMALEEQIKSIQLIFKNLVQVTYKQTGYLEIEFNNKITSHKNATTGRLLFRCSIPDENSHGRLHMKINMFDLTWFIYRIINKLNINFLIHDGSYSNPDPYVKGILLKYMHQILLEYKSGQYFVTLNATELLPEDLEELDKMGCICAKLDRLENDNNRFFGFKFS